MPSIPSLPADEQAMIDEHEAELERVIDEHVRTRILPDLRKMDDHDGLVWRTWDDRWLQALGWTEYGHGIWVGPSGKTADYDKLRTKRVLREYDAWAAKGHE